MLDIRSRFDHMIEHQFQRPRLQQTQTHLGQQCDERPCDEQSILPDMWPKVSQDAP